MTRLLLVAVLVAGAVLVAWSVQRRRPVPSRTPVFHVPNSVDRTLFDRPDAPWLVAVFTSSSCDTCAAMIEKARPLASDAVAVQELEARADKAMHERYSIDAVPLVLLVDLSGAVRAHFFGPTSASDLWAALATLREAPD